MEVRMFPIILQYISTTVLIGTNKSRKETSLDVKLILLGRHSCIRWHHGLRRNGTQGSTVT